jgi:hypothetical protein
MASVDLTPLINTVVGGVVSIAVTAFGAWVSVFVMNHIKDKQAALAVSNAVQNSLGKIQQAGQAVAEGQIAKLRPQLNVPDYLAPGVQYVLDHAGEEAARFGLTPEAIADKISAKLGLKNMEMNLAITQSAMPIAAAPLAPVTQAVAVVDTPIKPEEPSSESAASPKP